MTYIAIDQTTNVDEDLAHDFDEVYELLMSSQSERASLPTNSSVLMDVNHPSSVD